MSNIFRGMTHFNEFKQANPTISNHVLAQTLKYMEEQDLITKTVVDELHNRTEYALTPKGLRANKILYEITEYYFEELNYTNYDDMEVEELLGGYREIYDVR